LALAAKFTAQVPTSRSFPESTAALGLGYNEAASERGREPLEELRKRLVEWIAAEVRRAGAAGTVVGLSGGIDSAVAAVLCHQAFGDKALAVSLPIGSLPQDISDAALVARTFGLRFQVVALEKAYSGFLRSVPDDIGTEETRAMATANVKPRLRMLTLYYMANTLNYLVVGTSNQAELAVGYFTKYGDGGADILPIAGLVKREIRDLAAHLGIPQPIIDKAPSAGLWAGQTDEGEMGLTYRDIDAYLRNGQVDPEAARLIGERHHRSEHKRSRPPIAPVDDLLS
jgi:NAD+ synthase